MFGQNDNTQAQNNLNPATATSVPSPAAANPFAESDTPVPPSAPADTLSSAAPTPDPVPDPTPLPAPDPAVTATAALAGDDLLGLKQQALQSLQPLVSHLDQSPEEKFKTTMMLIQATDNSTLVKQAYEAASQISDEKARAQALLDVVNEINYFTHKDSAETKT